MEKVPFKDYLLLLKARKALEDKKARLNPENRFHTKEFIRINEELEKISFSIEPSPPLCASLRLVRDDH